MRKQTLFAIGAPLLLFGGGFALLNVDTLLQKESEPEVYEIIGEADDVEVGATTPEIQEVAKVVAEGNDRLARETCVNHGGGISMHVHPVISIKIQGNLQKIPSDIGIDRNCMRAIHTHDGTGKLHIEYPKQHEFTLGDFFANWGEAFSDSQILDKKTNIQFGITLFVDGEESTEFEHLVLKDGQKIEIVYEKREK